MCIELVIPPTTDYCHHCSHSHNRYKNTDDSNDDSNDGNDATDDNTDPRHGTVFFEECPLHVPIRVGSGMELDLQQSRVESG